MLGKLFKKAFKDMGKERITLDIIAGGNEINKTGKPMPAGIPTAVIIMDVVAQEIDVEIPFLSREAWRIVGVEWEEAAQRSAGKAAGGAIAGTLVAGPLGTIAGAAIGGRKRDNSKAYLTLAHVATGDEARLHIRCDESLYGKLSSHIK